jgi:hypothetical protein
VYRNRLKDDLNLNRSRLCCCWCRTVHSACIRRRRSRHICIRSRLVVGWRHRLHGSRRQRCRRGGHQGWILTHGFGEGRGRWNEPRAADQQRDESNDFHGIRYPIVASEVKCRVV